MFSNDGKNIVITRSFATPVDKLFTAWSNPTIFKTWWKEIKVAEMDFREGGSYKLQWDEPCSSAKADGSTAADTGIKGTYKQIIPNKMIVFTWEGFGGNAETKDNLVTLTFKDKGANLSEMELKHEFSNSEKMRDSHHDGWTWAMLDLDKHFNAPVRTINPEIKVEVSKTFAHPVSKVFGAWTNSANLAKWFNRDGATVGSAHTEAKVGTTFFMDYNRGDGGGTHRLYGTYSEIELNKKLTFSWVEDSDAGRTAPDYGYPTKVTVLFEELGAHSTKVNITHYNLSSSVLAENFRGGWTSCLNGIEKFLGA